MGYKFKVFGFQNPCLWGKIKIEIPNSVGKRKSEY